MSLTNLTAKQPAPIPEPAPIGWHLAADASASRPIAHQAAPTRIRVNHAAVTAALGLLLLLVFALCLLAAVWTSDTRWTWTGLLAGGVAIVLFLVAASLSGRKAANR